VLSGTGTVYVHVTESTICCCRQELDREQAAINEGKGRGIGLLGDWQGAEHWYGGKIQQTATLVELESESESSRASPSKTPKKPARPPQFSIKLDRVESTRSHGIGRFYGSRRILQVRIDKKIEKKLKDQDVMDFMSQKFVICGRVFVPFDSKDSTIYMVETNEDVDREPVDWEGDQYRMSFSDFVKWFNPLHLNYKQASTGSGFQLSHF
jgi:RNA-dependent RNA polymerase